ncbi:MAG: hypothetical protein RI926_700 [Actinomycetota bacterium]
MTLHLSQIFLTLGFTFIVLSFFAVFVPVKQAVTSQQPLFVAVDDTSTGEVVRAELYDDLVLREDSDVVLAHLARDVGKNLVAISQLNAEHSVGQRFGDRTFDLDDAVFFGHNSLIALLGITGLADAK